MTNRRLATTTRVLATLLLVGLGSAAIATAGDLGSPSPCALAGEYERQADAFDAGAERYRAWATAAGVLANDPTTNEWTFTREADRLVEAAKQSRRRAAEARRSAVSQSASASNVDCALPSRS